MLPQGFQNRILCVGHLKPRTMLAGNILVDIESRFGVPTLTVSGDRNDNSVWIRGLAGGQTEIQGSRTTLNGQKQSLSFSNISAVEINLESGNDYLRTSDLEVESLLVRGGSGNDRIHLEHTSNSKKSLELNIYSDASADPDVPTSNGNDSIMITDTLATGALSLFIASDEPDAMGSGGKDRIALIRNSAAVDQNGSIQISEDKVLADQGNDILIQDLKVRGNSTGISFSTLIQGGPGDDTFSLSDIDADLQGVFANLLDFGVVSNRGNDSIRMDDVSLVSTISASGDEALDGAGNAVALTLSAPKVDVIGIRLEGGQTFETRFGTWLYPTDLIVEADRFVGRDVELFTHGWGGVSLSERFEVAGNPNIDNNFQISSARLRSLSGRDAHMSFFANAGNDAVSLTDVSMERLMVQLGDGDDIFTIRNCRTDSQSLQPLATVDAFIDLGKGNDRLVASNNSLDVFFADLGEGDDTVVLIGNRFRGELEIDGGPGTDRLLDINNIALMRRWIRFE